VLAIAAHNIPEGMAVASPIYYSTGSRFQALFWCFISGACEPIAALFFALFLSSYITEELVFFLLASVAGIMVVVSLKELLPTALDYILSEEAMISSMMGMMFMSASIYFLHEQGGHHHGHDHGNDEHLHDHHDDHHDDHQHDH